MGEPSVRGEAPGPARETARHTAGGWEGGADPGRDGMALAVQTAGDRRRAPHATPG